ncbi:MAG: HAMP domain-containing protein [Chloroflexi bacterium]|nr:HAMP domain-containing protein [Chloroflexota bacterium]
MAICYNITIGFPAGARRGLSLSFLKNLTLGNKIILFTSLGLVLGIGVLGFLGIHAVNQATDVMLQDRLTTAGLVADHIDETLSYTLGELEHTAQAIEANRDETILAEQFAELENTFSRLAIVIHSIYFLDAGGRVVKPDDLAGLDLSALTAVAQAIARDKATITSLDRAPRDGTPVFFLISPVGGARGEKGYLALAIDPAKSSIGGFVQPIRLGRSGYVEIVDQNGLVVARTEPGPKLASFEQSDHSGRFAQLITAGKPTQGVCHTCHEPQQKVERKDVLAFVPLARASWGVAIRQSEEEALTPARELRQSLFLFGAGLTVAALIFVLITTRDVGRRLAMLTAASRRFADGDLMSPVSASGNDEIGILSRSFNEMRVKLRKSYSELEQKTSELSSLLSVSEIMNSNRELPGLLKAVLDKAVEVIPGAEAGLLLLPGDGATLKVECVSGLSPGTFPEFVSEGKVGIEELKKSLAPGNLPKNCIYAGVARERGLIIMVNFREDGAFSGSDRRLLQAIADDISLVLEKARLTEEAEQARAWYEADRLRSEFISSVSHELRTPLTLIKGYSTSLLRQDTTWDDQSRREFLQIIDDKTDELRDLIDKLLESAKLEAGVVRLEKEPVLIPRMARKVVEEISIRARNHRFTLDFVKSFPVVEADTRCIRQILQNLVENAVKYSPEGSEITIGGQPAADGVTVSVTDNGIGIPLEHQGKIFDRFYRVKNRTMPNIPGSGLGLAIVRGHVEAHGGKVWFESVAGRGSSFYFSLPAMKIE